MSEEVVLIEENEDKSIITIKLNRLNKKNAINYGIMEGLVNAFDNVEQSKARVIIITGQEDAFSAGIDLKTLSGQDPSAPDRIKNIFNPPNFRYILHTLIQPILIRIEKIEKPIIARINGYCFGLGFEMALACDFRFALANTQMNLVETKLGLIPDVGGTTRLTRIAGIMHAKDVILTGRTFEAKEAYRMGILNGIAKDVSELDKLIKTYTDELIDSAPLAVGLGKKLIDDCYGKDLAFGMELEGLVNSQLLKTKDMTIGVAARLQKVKPKWRAK